MWTVDYSSYHDTYGGTVIDKRSWTRISYEACAYIDEITYGRLRRFSSIPVEVQLAVCAVADVIYAQRTALAHHDTAAGIKSFSNDGYSETLADAVHISDEFARRKADAAAVYLPRSHPIRYAGIY